MQPIHEQLDQVFQQHLGRLMTETSIENIRHSLKAALVSLTLQDRVFSYGCPVETVVFLGEFSGEVGWAFRVTDDRHILWFSNLHKGHVDTHFPAERFLNGRPELPA